MQSSYDTIIIGAGIGGLVCGNYLSRAGKKVLIVERHHRSGGYCTSYRRGKFVFDGGPHSLGSMRRTGQLGKLLSDLDLYSKIELIHNDPSDILIFPDTKVAFYNSMERTIDVFSREFPKERQNIKKFFDFLNVPNIGFLYSYLKNKTFKALLDLYFSDYKVKAVFGSMLGNLGLRPKDAAAFTSAILYREYIFDGGYYPKGGMQEFTTLLESNFKNLGGEIRFSAEADKILVKNKKVEGVRINSQENYYARTVVSNCDATQTYCRLLAPDVPGTVILEKMQTLSTSPSFFVVHLGLKSSICEHFSVPECSTMWYFPSYDIDLIYEDAFSGRIDLVKKNQYLVWGFPRPNPGDTIINLYILAPFMNKVYWDKNKESYTANVINRASNLYPSIESNIEKISLATPYDFYRYTLNKNGAISGWASVPSQIGTDIVPMKTNIKGLFLTGHWVTSAGGQGGVPMVAFSGKKTAQLILEGK